jgi:hypothetical protein
MPATGRPHSRVSRPCRAAALGERSWHGALAEALDTTWQAYALLVWYFTLPPNHPMRGHEPGTLGYVDKHAALGGHVSALRGLARTALALRSALRPPERWFALTDSPLADGLQDGQEWLQSLYPCSGRCETGFVRGWRWVLCARPWARAAVGRWS